MRTVRLTLPIRREPLKAALDSPDARPPDDSRIVRPPRRHRLSQLRLHVSPLAPGAGSGAEGGRPEGTALADRTFRFLRIDRNPACAVRGALRHTGRRPRREAHRLLPHA